MTARPPSSAAPACDTTRVQALLNAHWAITSDLALSAMLERIVGAARELGRASRGALAVFDPDDSIEHFVDQGLDALVVAAIRSGRVPAGFQSLLRVPILVRGNAFGELYLADSAADGFDQADEELVTMLAASAGTAIENARLLEQARRSRDWLDAAGDVARALLADADDEALLDVVSQALDIAEADYAALILPVDRNELKVTVAKGVGSEEFLGHVFSAADSPLGRAIIEGESCRTNGVVEWFTPNFVNRHDWGPGMLAPLVDAHGTRGAILLIRRSGRLPFLPEDVEQASTFAIHVALAFELNDARADAEWLRVIEDRHRIAQDLHDNVMQRLFATGVGLQVLAGASAMDGASGERLGRHIADLDDTIEQIRVRVFDLRDADAPQLRHQRSRYPHVGSGPSAAESGESRDSRGANPGPMRSLIRPTVPGADD